MEQYQQIREEILSLSACSVASLRQMPEAGAVFGRFKELLNRGGIRAAEKSGGSWVVNRWVKEGILLGMRLGRLIESHVELPGTGSSLY